MTAAASTPARASRGTRRERARETGSPTGAGGPSPLPGPLLVAMDTYSTGRRYEGERTTLYATRSGGDAGGSSAPRAADGAGRRASFWGANGARRQRSGWFSDRRREISPRIRAVVATYIVRVGAKIGVHVEVGIRFCVGSLARCRGGGIAFRRLVRWYGSSYN
jgi:hypothetical protein